MAITSWIRRSFKDGVATTDTLPSGCSAAATSLSLASGSSFPDGSIGPFIVTIDQGLATEEKVLIASRSGATLTVAASGRGYNGTTAQSHGTSASVLHTIDAQDMDEANQTAVATLGAVQASGDLLVGSGANALSRLARGAANQFLQTVGSNLQWTGFGVAESQTVASANADGTQTTPARSDHAHSGVATFNTRNGAVTPTTGDYTVAQVTGAAPIASPTFTGITTAPEFTASGLTGATAATRYVGATASGAPASGTFAVGDFVIDQTGIVWVCTGAGTPGTWVNKTLNMTGVDGAMAGSAPSVGGGPFSIVAGQATITVSAGNWNYSFPTTFANGLLAAAVTACTAAGDIDLVTLTHTSSTKAALYGQYFRNGSPLSAATLISYVAIGW